MKNVIVEFGCESRNVIFIDKEVGIEYSNERDFIRKCLIVEFGSEEECISYWNEFCGFENMEEVVNEIIEIREIDLNLGNDLGYVSSEEGFFKIKS
jgi:hypothetical protein